MYETFRQWLRRLVCPPREDINVSPEVRDAAHELRNASANLQGAAAQIRREADAIDRFVTIMHGERSR